MRRTVTRRIVASPTSCSVLREAYVTDHRQLRVRFYPTAGKWLCVVQQLGGDGMPTGGDVVSATGDTKDSARQAAIDASTDPEVVQLLREH